MTKEELEKEAKTECFMLTVNTIGIDQRDVELAYVIGAEPREKRIAELEKDKDYFSDALDKQIEATLKLQKENEELNKKLSDVLECFISASSGDDFEMAESAREVMEVLNIRCYRHGEVKSKLTNAKEIIREFVEWATWQGNSKCPSFKSIQDKAEQFLKEIK